MEKDEMKKEKTNKLTILIYIYIYIKYVFKITILEKKIQNSDLFYYIQVLVESKSSKKNIEISTESNIRFFIRSQ